jgi:hypothetical protein
MSRVEKTFEMHTKASISPPMTKELIAKALLIPSEYEGFHQSYNALSVDGLLLHMGRPAYEAILPHLKPESLANGSVKSVQDSCFQWNMASWRICKDFGLSSLSVVGSKNKVTGLILSAVVEEKDQQKRKFITFVRALKQKLPNYKITWENCQQTIACDIQGI